MTGRNSDDTARVPAKALPLEKRGYSSGGEPVVKLPKPVDPGPAGAAQDGADDQGGH